MRVLFKFLLLFPLLALGQVDSASEKGIKLQDFSVKKLRDGRLKIKFSAKAYGDVSIGSYAIAVDGFNGDHVITNIDGLTPSSGSLYVVSNDFPNNEILLRDNGQLDEDKRKGRFAYTLNTTKWPAARYHIKVFAMNRPAKGTYYAGQEIYRFDKGITSVPNSAPSFNVENQIVWRKKGIYAYFPSLFQLDDGRLVTRFATRLNPSHIDTTGGMKTLISDNNGQTWFEPKSYFSIPTKKTKDGRLVSVAAGGWKYEDYNIRASNGKSNLTNKISKKLPGNRIAYLSTEATVRTSTDNGVNWNTENIRVPDDIAGLMQFSALRTHNGVHLVGLYGYRRSGKKDNTEVFFIRSVDDGKTWDFVFLTPGGMNEPSLNPSETSLTELPNGDILVMIRTEKTIYSSISADSGRTWSTPKDTGIQGYPPFVLVLPDGRLLCLYSYRKNPMGIRAVISRDNGETWDLDNKIIIRDDGLSIDEGNIGYPRAVLLPDGEVFVIYYFTTDGHTPFIASSKFKVPPL